MSTFNVSNAAGLTAALAAAKAGDTILLAAGTYSDVRIKNTVFNGTVTIASADPTHAAVLTGLLVQNSSGLAFSHLDLSTVGTANPSSTSWANPFNVENCSNIQLTGLNVSGTPLLPGDSQPNGLLVRGSSNVTISGCEFQHVHVGLTELNNTNIVISNNNFHDIGNDGMDNAGSSYVQVTGNSFTNFDRTNLQHPDAIQFWTTGTTTSAHDITISNNTITRGSGTIAQGIFVTDQVGTLPYLNVSITNNTVIGEQGNGIEVNDGRNVNISNNYVLSYSDVISRIVLENVTSGTVSYNHAERYVFNSATTVAQEGNSFIAPVTSDYMMTSVSTTLASTLHSLVFTGTAAVTGVANNLGDTIIANNAGDHLIGGSGADTLVGGAGNDFIVAGTGVDRLSGGGGTNTFMFSAHSGQDTITDMTKGVHDVIDISAILNAGSHAILHNSGNNVTISFDHNSATITLLGVHSTDLHATAVGFTV